MNGEDTIEKGDRETVTRGVSILTGDPMKAILRLSAPMIVAMLLISVYNLVDAIWVAGLGPDALAAVGFIMPVFMVFIGLGSGLGAGVTSAIARRIGAGDKPGADSTAMHGLVIAILLSVILTIPLFLLARPLVESLGAGRTADLGVEYGRIIFTGIVFFLFSNSAYGILRAEGDTKRTMYAMAASAVLNMILDPILIYSAGLGVAGAALATVLSAAFVCAVLLYWMMIRKDTYVSLSMKAWSFRRDVVVDILQVGLPAGCEFLLMSVLAAIINGILVTVSGTDAVAVYTAGWRVVFFAIIPLVGIATSVVSVGGAAFGGRRYGDLSTAYTFAVTIGVGISLATSILTWTLAPQITTVFTYSAESAHLAPSIAAFLRTMCFFFPFVPLGIMSTSIFQATGKGIISFLINLLRNLVFSAFFAYWLAIVLGWGEAGAWWGIVAGNILACTLAFLLTRYYISRLIRYADPEDTAYLPER